MFSMKALHIESQQKRKMVKGLRKRVKTQKKVLKKKDAEIATLQKQLSQNRSSMSEPSTSFSQTINESIINQQAAQINNLQAKLQKYELMILNQLEQEVEMEQDTHSQPDISLTPQPNDDIMDFDVIHNAEGDDLDKVMESCQDSLCLILEGIKTPYDDSIHSKSSHH